MPLSRNMLLLLRRRLLLLLLSGGGLGLGLGRHVDDRVVLDGEEVVQGVQGHVLVVVLFLDVVLGVLGVVPEQVEVPEVPLPHRYFQISKMSNR